MCPSLSTLAGEQVDLQRAKHEPKKFGTVNKTKHLCDHTSDHKRQNYKFTKIIRKNFTQSKEIFLLVYIFQ